MTFDQKTHFTPKRSIWFQYTHRVRIYFHNTFVRYIILYVYNNATTDFFLCGPVGVLQSSERISLALSAPVCLLSPRYSLCVSYTSLDKCIFTCIKALAISFCQLVWLFSPKLYACSMSEQLTTDICLLYTYRFRAMIIFPSPSTLYVFITY